MSQCLAQEQYRVTPFPVPEYVHRQQTCSLSHCHSCLPDGIFSVDCLLLPPCHLQQQTKIVFAARYLAATSHPRLPPCMQLTMFFLSPSLLPDSLSMR